MTIHKVKSGETLSDIANFYGLCEGTLAEINGLEGGKIAVGEELLVLVPTRVHTARHGDSVERLCLRYKVRKSDVLAFNPSLCQRRLEIGERVALKFDERAYGMAATNGYVYKGTSAEALELALPYMTYATFASVYADASGIHAIYNEEPLLKKAISASKIPLIRIHDKYTERYENEEMQSNFCEEIIELAKGRGYKGIVLNSVLFSHSADYYMRFLMNLKKQMIGSDLILITECDENSQKSICDLSDGCILSYTAIGRDNIPSFEDGEKKAIADFACECESIKSFVDIPSFARCDDEYIEIENAKNQARSSNAEIFFDEVSLLSKFQAKNKSYAYPSLSSIKAVLELLSEYGYMGISFDVSKTPKVFLMMYNAMYKTVCAAL